MTKPKPKPKPKRKNVQDLTLRNLRAMKKRIEKLEKANKELEAKLNQVITFSISQDALELSKLSPEEFCSLIKSNSDSQFIRGVARCFKAVK